MPRQLPTTRNGHPRQRAWRHRLVVVVLLLAGAAAMVWPVAETVEGNRQGAAWTTEYVLSVRSSSPRELSEDLRAARAYNAELPAEALNDPWGAGGAGATAAHDRYLRTIARSKGIGRLRIPQIAVDLPIFHDADRLSMSRGVGHMYGSSLPVGGPDTHAVLAAHTGLRGRTMFDRLPELQLGQTFGIDIAGETLTYRIDRIVVVEPWELEAVQRVPGGDHVTLVTCYTPPGEHKQRMLVRGVRMADDPGATLTITGSTTTMTDGPATAGFDTTIQGWMWPRLAGATVALAILAAMVVAWILGDRRAGRAAPRRYLDDGPILEAAHARPRTDFP
ncbi:MAG: class C sortase [Propionibacteriaceae bacterium]|nr:class C sortase [Propionibacteriaceae bacterium]